MTAGDFNDFRETKIFNVKFPGGIGNGSWDEYEGFGLYCTCYNASICNERSSVCVPV
jgi:hypothetical protein